jgi:hypothetical protein
MENLQAKEGLALFSKEELGLDCQATSNCSARLPQKMTCGLHGMWQTKF